MHRMIQVDMGASIEASGLAGSNRMMACALRAALEAVPAVALIVQSDGVIAEANRLGWQWLRSQRRSALRPEEALAAGEFRITRLDARVAAPHYLLVCCRPNDDISVRLQQRSAQWSLTERQCTVLEHVVRGESNARIAVALGISPRTVEQHVAAILHRSGCHTRRELTARFWS